MAQSEKTVRALLREAALDLFREAGYERTTAAQIAARVGVTERTFFRHYRDKREVLFDGEAVLRDALTAAIAEAPDAMAAWAVLFRAFHAVVPLLEANRAFSEPFWEVVSRTPALRERDLAKQDTLAEALATALQVRGVAAGPAKLAARIGMAAFVHATVAWLDQARPGLAERLDAVFRDVAELSRDA